MPGTVPLVSDERELLLAYVAQQRDGIRYAARGLTDEQAKTRPVASSALSIAGLVKHAAQTERGWVAGNVCGLDLGPDRYDQAFDLAPGETLAGVLARYADVAAETERLVRALDLDRPVPIPPAPWFPDEGEWSVRWVLLHLIEETARHAGHADILREAIDGATMYQLMAEAEGWSDKYAQMLAYDPASES